MMENLESTGAIAVTASRPTTYFTMQMIGRVDYTGAPTDEHRTGVDTHLRAFGEEVAQLGVTAGAANLFLGDLFVVGFEIEELFDQTPGPKAGSKLW